VGRKAHAVAEPTKPPPIIPIVLFI